MESIEELKIEIKKYEAILESKTCDCSPDTTCYEHRKKHLLNNLLSARISERNSILKSLDDTELIAHYGKTQEERLAITNYVKDFIKFKSINNRS